MLSVAGFSKPRRGLRTGQTLLGGGLFAAGVLLAALAASPRTATAADPHAPAANAAAAHDAHDAHGAAHDAGGHDHHAPKVYGKPPKGLFGKGTEFLAISPELFLFTLVVFLILLFVLRNLAWRPILASLEARDAKIAESLAAAEQARTEARKLLEQQEAEMGKAHDVARRLLEEVRAQASTESEALISQAREQAAKQQEEAQRQIASAREEALADLRNSAAAIAGSMVAKTTNKRLPAQDFQRLIEEIEP